MTNTVLIKRSSAANSVPSAGNLQPGELAINYNDGNLFYKNTSNVVTVIASNQFVSVSGNVTGGNVVTTGAVSASSVTSSNSVNFASAGNVSLGGVANIHITGGTAGYVLSTNGSGNLSWVAQSGGGGGGSTITVDDFTGDGTTTSFALSVTPPNIESTTVNYNGVIQLRTGYSLSGSNIVFSTAPANGASIEVTSISVNITGSAVAGSNTQVQFNNAGNFGASSAFTFNTATSNLGVPNLNVTGNIMPTSNNVYNIGAPDMVFKHVYIGPGSLYVDGTKVLGSSANTIIVSADLNQNVRITTTGTGDVELLPAGTGSIAAKGPLQIQAGKSILSSDGNAVAFASPIGVDTISSRTANTDITMSALGTGHVRVDDDLIVTGNLTVQGTGGNLSVTNLTVEDNIIDISAETTGTPTQNAGLRVVRGDEPATSLRWYESGDVWQFTNDGTTYLSMVGKDTAGNVTVGNIATGIVSASGNITGNNISAGNVNLSNLSVSGYVTSNLLPLANITYNLGSSTRRWNELWLASSTIYIGNSSISANSESMTLTNPAGGSLTIAGSSSDLVAVNVTATGNVVTGAASVTGAVSAGGNVTSGNLLTGGLISSIGNIMGGNVNGAGWVTGGNVSTGGNVLVGGYISVVGNLYVANVVSSSNLVVQDPLVYFTSTSTYPYNYDIGFYSHFTGDPGNTYQHTGLVRDYVDNTWKLFSNVPEPEGTSINFANAIYDPLRMGALTATTGAFSSTVSATANITGGNVLTGGLISATGNIRGNNISAVGDVNANNVLTPGVISATGNITGGNILGGANVNATTHTGATASLSGNVTGGNILTGGLISATGNISAGNLSGTNIVGTLTTAAQNNITSVGTLTSLNSGAISSSGNIIGANISTGGIITATGNISSSGNISGSYILGNGSQLTGISVSSSKIFNGTSEANIGVSGGNANVSIGGTANVAVFANTGVYVTGLVSATGNIVGGNITTSGAAGNITGANVIFATTFVGTQLSGTSNVITVLSGTVLSVVGNTIGGNLLTGGVVSATANVTGGNVLTAGLISATGNISSAGNVSGTYFLGNGSLLTGISTSATKIFNGTSEANIGVSGGNANVSIGGTANVAVFANTGVYVTGLVSASGNITGGNIATAAVISAAGNITSAVNVTGGNLLTSGIVSAASHIGSVVSVTANITGAYFLGNGSQLTGITSTATPAGANTQIQFNDAGSLGASANLTFDKSTNTLNATTVTANGVPLATTGKAIAMAIVFGF